MPQLRTLPSAVFWHRLLNYRPSVDLNSILRAAAVTLLSVWRRAGHRHSAGAAWSATGDVSTLHCRKVMGFDPRPGSRSYWFSFQSRFAELRKPTITHVIPMFCPSVCITQLDSHCKGLSEFAYYSHRALPLITHTALSRTNALLLFYAEVSQIAVVQVCSTCVDPSWDRHQRLLVTAQLHKHNWLYTYVLKL
jgi:hypothetical protein